jgi:hypothetical protein
MTGRCRVSGDAPTLRDDVLEGMYQLAYCLHPDNGIALSVTLEACERLVIIRRLQGRRTGHSRIRLAEACLPNIVYISPRTHVDADKNKPRHDFLGLCHSR